MQRKILQIVKDNRREYITKKYRIQTILEEALAQHSQDALDCEILKHAVWDARELLPVNTYQEGQFDFATCYINLTVRHVLTQLVEDLQNGLDLQDSLPFVMGILYAADRLCECAETTMVTKRMPEFWDEEMKSGLSKDGLGKDGQDDDD